MWLSPLVMVKMRDTNIIKRWAHVARKRKEKAGAGIR